LLVRETGTDLRVRYISTTTSLTGIHADNRPGPKTVNYPPPEGKKPDAEYIYQTNAESAHLYR
jgi:hypothetical protein